MLFLAFFVGCGEPEIVYYETEKKEHKSNQKVKEEIHNHSPYAWDKPKSWTQKLGGSMRVVSFSLAKSDLDVSIVQLGGSAGGLVANINRWRGQLSLADETEENILTSLKKESSKISGFSWIQLSNESESFLVSIYNLPGLTLFVKAKGSIKTIDAEKENFLNLCKSIRVNDHQH